ncbi:MAG: flagellar biosynthetic protein FliQ [Bryobacterales bacterium]|nr:flagellar biosynthetic protein FliQ [Bryobacteraceae bacterium]MDW8355259.1 flagellar biosynthetic protein FliQ [Bryobacterales bacterium]
MSPELVVESVRQALMTAFWVGAPLLAVGFVAGVAVSLVQIVTSIQDTAFNSVPRLVAFLAGLVVLLPWMLERMTHYALTLFGDFSRYAR